jgi:hypothetical protein
MHVRKTYLYQNTISVPEHACFKFSVACFSCASGIWLKLQPWLLSVNRLRQERTLFCLLWPASPFWGDVCSRPLKQKQISQKWSNISGHYSNHLCIISRLECQTKSIKVLAQEEIPSTMRFTTAIPWICAVNSSLLRLLLLLLLPPRIRSVVWSSLLFTLSASGNKMMVIRVARHERLLFRGKW